MQIDRRKKKKKISSQNLHADLSACLVNLWSQWCVRYSSLAKCQASHYITQREAGRVGCCAPHQFCLVRVCAWDVWLCDVCSHKIMIIPPPLHPPSLLPSGHRCVKIGIPQSPCGSKKKRDHLHVRVQRSDRRWCQHYAWSFFFYVRTDMNVNLNILVPNQNKRPFIYLFVLQLRFRLICKNVPPPPRRAHCGRELALPNLKTPWPSSMRTWVCTVSAENKIKKIKSAHRFANAKPRAKKSTHAPIWRKCFCPWDYRLSDMIHVNWWGGGGVSDRLVVWLHCRCLTRSGTPLLDPRAHSPVLVSSADMLHATKRTLQMKHTWTNSISLLFRTLNILAMIVFLDGPAASSCSILRALFGG